MNYLLFVLSPLRPGTHGEDIAEQCSTNETFLSKILTVCHKILLRNCSIFISVFLTTIEYQQYQIAIGGLTSTCRGAKMNVPSFRSELLLLMEISLQKFCPNTNVYRGGARNFPTGGLTLPTRGAKIWFLGYYKCQKSPKKSCFTFRRLASMLLGGL